MSLSHEMEHAAHAGGHGSDGKRIGITMAIIGVLIAICSGLLGGVRAELTATLVTQNSVGNEYQAASTKYRVTMAQLQQLHAILPTDPQFDAKARGEADELARAATDHNLAKMTRIEFARLANTVTPSPEDALRMVRLAGAYEQERAAAGAWRESFDPAIAAHAHAAHGFEWAMLASEFGLILCTIALLLTNRKVWLVAIAVAAVGAVLLIRNGLAYRSHLGEADDNMSEAEKAFAAIDKNARRAEDDALLGDIERTQTIAAGARR